ncbi:MAG: chorismate synthase [archaeon]|jgi:chorismate synthase
MSGNSYGELFNITTFGESHGEALGVIVDGCPAGIPLCEADIQKDLDKRKPGQGLAGTKRSESDTIKILSGVFEGKTTGTPIALVTFNENQKSQDYNDIKNVFRPGHADFTYHMKYDGNRDYRGGGRSSARETLARVAGGAIAKKILAKEGIKINGYVKSIGNVAVNEDNFNQKDIEKVYENELRCPDKNAIIKMEKELKNAIINQDSVGGVVEVIAKNMLVGLGEPVYDKLSAEIGKAMLSINATKGVEIGEGFAGTKMRGSIHNDAMQVKNGKIKFLSNHAGGIVGGISTGEDVVVRVAFKPLSSIAKEQNTITKDLKNTKIKVVGRHDVCVCPRAVPVVEAMLAIVLVNALMQQKARQF